MTQVKAIAEPDGVGNDIRWKSVALVGIHDSQEIFENITELYTQFEAEHNGTTKAAKSRARKAIGEIKKLVTDYRKASVEENK